MHLIYFSQESTAWKKIMVTWLIGTRCHRRRFRLWPRPHLEDCCLLLHRQRQHWYRDQLYYTQLLCWSMSIRNQYVRNLLPLLKLKISYQNYQQCIVDYTKMHDEKILLKKKWLTFKIMNIHKALITYITCNPMIAN